MAARGVLIVCVAMAGICNRRLLPQPASHDVLSQNSLLRLSRETILEKSEDALQPHALKSPIYLALFSLFFLFRLLVQGLKLFPMSNRIPTHFTAA